MNHTSPEQLGTITSSSHAGKDEDENERDTLRKLVLHIILKLVRYSTPL